MRLIYTNSKGAQTWHGLEIQSFHVVTSHFTILQENCINGGCATVVSAIKEVLDQQASCQWSKIKTLMSWLKVDLNQRW